MIVVLWGVATLIAIDVLVWAVAHARSNAPGGLRIVDANLAVITLNVIVIALLMSVLVVVRAT